MPADRRRRTKARTRPGSPEGTTEVLAYAEACPQPFRHTDLVRAEVVSRNQAVSVLSWLRQMDLCTFSPVGHATFYSIRWDRVDAWRQPFRVAAAAREQVPALAGAAA